MGIDHRLDVARDVVALIEAQLRNDHEGMAAIISATCWPCALSLLTATAAGAVAHAAQLQSLPVTDMLTAMRERLQW